MKYLNLCLLLLPVILFAEPSESVLSKTAREYKERGIISEVRNLIRDISTGEEAYFINNTGYLSCETSVCVAELEKALQAMSPFKIRITPSQEIKVIGTQDSYKIWARDSQLPNEVVYWDSLKGGMQDGTSYNWP